MNKKFTLDYDYTILDVIDVINRRLAEHGLRIKLTEGDFDGYQEGEIIKIV